MRDTAGARLRWGALGLKDCPFREFLQCRMEFSESGFLGKSRDSERKNENPRSECNFSEAVMFI